MTSLDIFGNRQTRLRIDLASQCWHNVLSPEIQTSVQRIAKVEMEEGKGVPNLHSEALLFFTGVFCFIRKREKYCVTLM